MKLIGKYSRYFGHGCLLVFVLCGAVLAAEQQGSSNGQLTREAALALAMAHNPELAGYAAATLAAKATADQSGRGLNPELEFELENFAGSGDASGMSAAEYTLMLSQTFELGGKRARAQELATQDVELIRLAALLGARNIRARVSNAFFAALESQSAVTLADELVALAEQDLEFVQRQITSGAVSPVEANRARLAVAAAGLAAEATRDALAARRLQLSVLWNSVNPDFGDLYGNLEDIAPLPEWDELSAQLAFCSQLQIWDIHAKRQQAEIAAMESLGKIDLTVAAGVRHYADTGDNALVAAVSAPLPFRDSNADAVRAAGFGLDRLGAERQAQYVALLGELARHYEVLTTSHQQITTMRAEILPLARQSMVEVDTAYHKGLFSLTDVMAARRTWHETQGTYQAALARYQQATIDVDLILAGVDRNAATSQESE